MGSEQPRRQPEESNERIYVGVKPGVIVLYLVALVVTTALLVWFLYLDQRPWYGNWPAVILSVTFFSLFVVGFLVALPRRDWRQTALGPAFLIALFTEMFGIPFTIYLLSSVFGFSIGLDGSEGHLWAVALDWLGWVRLSVGVPMLKWGGSAVVLTGLVLMGWGWWRVYRARGALVTDGLYRHVRHPQYVGFVLVMAGFLIQWPTLITLLMFPVLLAAYIRLAANEDVYLERTHGDAFRSYRKNVPGWLPRLR
ncbi:MAG: isoprenylcysteine carboxylmethyltransferase family protein [Chloroflexi bacterium]|nr:isoprenylcysteine carboxylmethyltransferase family protein [Chloroflexota bacterium]